MEIVPLLLASPFLDDRLLFRGYGITRHDVAEFADVYERVQPADRPPLSPYFDIEWYVETNPGLRDSGADPLVHFIREGFDRRRSPHPLVRLDFIELRQGELPPHEAGLAQLVAILATGSAAPTPYFDLEYYVESNPEARDYRSGPLGHFLEQAADEVFIPCRFFDADFYRTRYPDVPHSRRAAFVHFVAIGDGERRFPSARFDPDWYFHTHSDIARAEIAPLYHFMEFGQAEGRAPRDARRGFSTGPAQFTLENGDGEAPFAAPARGRERYEAVRDQLAALRRQRIGAVREAELRPVIMTDLARARELTLPCSDTPKVSIVIPMFNEVRVTIECLASIVNSGLRAPVEIIVADDCSTDRDVEIISKIRGVKYVRQPKNLNFLKNCNGVLPECRGAYVLLLNNDAQVATGAIDHLADALDGDASIGIVGPKFVFPTGRLQEAGCTINCDATATMIGVFLDASDPAYNFARDVDYVSGAALMVRRSLLGDAIFDEDLAPAYCEDLELCLRIGARGFRIRYVPDAVVVHHLSVTMSDHGLKMQRIARNQQKVLAKWHDKMSAMNRVRIIAFYLPQFHPIPENDLWWGQGFTEWTNVSKAQPSYQGHYQPHLPADLGFYDLRVPEIYAAQARLLKRYGLEGVCLYYYNFNGRTFLGKPLETILAHPAIDIKFCLCWANENWSRRWDGGSRDLLLEQLYDEETTDKILEDLSAAARDSRYIRVGGKPIFLIYRPLIIPDLRALVSRLRKGAQALLGCDLHLVFVESMESVNANQSPYDYGFDASVEFPPHGMGVKASDARDVLKAGWAGERYDYEETVKKAVLRDGVGWKRYPGVFPSWDNTARQPLLGTSFDNCSPEVFQLYVEEKIEECKRGFVGDERLLFVNAWNEWAEGAHLEPDNAYGHRWLEAIRHAVRARAWLSG